AATLLLQLPHEVCNVSKKWRILQWVHHAISYALGSNLESAEFLAGHLLVGHSQAYLPPLPGLGVLNLAVVMRCFLALDHLADNIDHWLSSLRIDHGVDQCIFAD